MVFIQNFIDMLKADYKKYIFYTVFLLFCVVIAAHYTDIDNDFWARLIQGKAFWQTGSVLKYDFLSYTKTHAWYDHEWGSSAIFYYVLSTFGDVGLMIFKGVLIFLVFYFVTKIVDMRGVSTTTAYNFLFYFFAFHALSDIATSTVRCQLLTFLFFAMWIYLLEKIRNGDNKLLFVLPVMMLVWSNFHGGCVSGLGVLAIYGVGELLNRKPFKKYFLAIIPCILVMFINPYGYEYVKFLAMATTMARPLITEWRASFDTRDIMESIHFKGFMSVMVFSWAAGMLKDKFSWEKLDKTKILMLLVTLILALKHIKHQPIFIITAASFLYNDFYNVFNAVIKFLRKLLHLNNETFIKAFVITKETVVYLGIAFYCCVAAFYIPFSPTVGESKYPIYAIEFIRANNIKGNLLLSFNYGSYAAYKLYPQNLIFMDGRYEEVYYDDLLPMLARLHVANVPGWDDAIKGYRTDVILMAKKYNIYTVLKNDKNWKRIFEDDKYAVFVPKNKAKKVYQLPNLNADFYNKTKWNTNINFQK